VEYEATTVLGDEFEDEDENEAAAEAAKTEWYQIDI
jgi:hypothetical protein